MKRIALLIISVFLFNQLKAQTDSTDIYKLSFEDLLSVNIKAGTLFKIKTQNLPVYITTITEDQIRNSGAKHMADLMEIYVPDLMYLLHTQVRIGSRGIINDRQEKTLVLVNGHCINQKTAVGATLEFTNWDLNDIDRIDIISGPGSVTYGPGAICSVISITTKNASTSPGIKAGLQYANTFQSKLAYASYGLKKDKFSAYVYGSYTATSGGAEGDFFSTKANGVADYQVKDNTMAKIFGDNLDMPQLKGYMELSYGDQWTLRSRYTNSGTTAFVNNGTGLTATKDASLYPGRFTGQSIFMTDLQNIKKITEKLSLTTNLGFSTIHHYDYLLTTSNNLYNQGSYGSVSKGNIAYDFQEKELSFNTVVNYELDKAKLALGYNFSFDMLGKSSGMDSVYLLYNNTKSLDGQLFFNQMYNGWNTSTHSLFGEIYLTPHPLANILFSARVDKNTYSEVMFSPRIAYIAEINQKNTLKFIMQQSVRMPSMEDLYKSHLNNQTGKSEDIKIIEADYITLLTHDMKGTFSTYYSVSDLRGWGGTEVIYIGTLKHWGLTVDFQYKNDKLGIGASHSHTKQLNFTSFDNTKRQGISFSDINANGLKSTGNDLFNWCNDISKFYSNFFWTKNFTSHIDAQVFWKWQGMLDALQSYSNKFESVSSTDAITWNKEKKVLEDEGYGKTDVRINASVTYKFPTKYNIEMTLFAMNLLETKRYVYNSGEDGVFPTRMYFYKEPRLLGVKLNIGL